MTNSGQFKPGQSGNPGGRKTERLVTEAIRIALHEKHKGTDKKKLRVLAEKLVNKAIEGDVQAMKEVADRMDGKPAQAIQADVTGGLTVEIVKYAGENSE